MSHLHDDFNDGRGLAVVDSMYQAARCVGDEVRRVAELDRAALERDNIAFNIHFLLGGQLKGAEPDLYLIYPQGNPLRTTQDSPYLQLGETKYGRPILDRGLQYHETSLELAAKYALISIDSTMRSNLTVGPPALSINLGWSLWGVHPSLPRSNSHQESQVYTQSRGPAD